MEVLSEICFKWMILTKWNNLSEERKESFPDHKDPLFNFIYDITFYQIVNKINIHFEPIDTALLGTHLLRAFFRRQSDRLLVQTPQHNTTV